MFRRQHRDRLEQGRNQPIMHTAAHERNERGLLVGEEINSAFIQNSPFGIWLLALREPVPTALGSSEQIEKILSTGFLSQFDHAFAGIYGETAAWKIETEEGFPDFLFENPRRFLSDFIQSGYRLTNYLGGHQKADKTLKRFKSDIFGMIDAGRLHGIWGTLHETVLSDSDALGEQPIKPERATRESRHFTQDALDSLNEHIAILDGEGRIIAVNRAWTRFACLSGLSEDAASVGIGSNYLDICLISDEETAVAAYAGVTEVLNGRKDFFRIEYPCHSPEEKRWFLLTVTPLTNNTGAVVSHLDITLQKAMEQEREELLAKVNAAYSEAAAANRLKDEFLSTISHELRTPLTSIVGWTQMLLEDKADAEMTRHGLETINRNALAQKQLIEDLLDVSRVITGKLKLEIQPINIETVIGSVIESVKPALSAKHISITENIESDLPIIYADGRRIQQILWNLLTNAIKFTPKKGFIEIAVQRVDSFVEIAVKDSGIGMKPDVLPHAFSRFSQADGKTTRRFGGLGLGLAIVRHLVEMHGGSVSAFSEGENKGSKFLIRLPIINSSDETAQHREKITTPADVGDTRKGFGEIDRLEGVKLLVVDDDRDNLELLTLLFNKFGAKVETAASASEALQKYLPFKPDLIISDIGMPDEDGYSLIKKIRKIAERDGRQKPAIALTAFAKTEDSRRALAAGFQRHLKKPVEPAELVEKVSELLRNWEEKK